MKTHPPIIFGSGQIGTAFKNSLNSIPDGWAILACGVSNSSAPKGPEHLRERNTLEQIIANHPHHNLLYFSTYGVLDSALKNRDYFQHKIEMERLILDTGRGRIVRLPNVVGPIHNPNTMMGYFQSCILSEKAPVIWESSQRYIVWSEDIPETLHQHDLWNNDKPDIICISSLQPYPVIHIWQDMCRITAPHLISHYTIKEGTTPSIANLQLPIYAPRPLDSLQYLRTTLLRFNKSLSQTCMS